MILAFAGQEVADSRALPILVAATEEGTDAEIVVYRDGQRETLRVKIGALQPVQSAAAAAAQTGDETVSTLDGLDATVADLDAETRDRMGLDEDVTGVVVTALEADGAAARAGLRVGDVILRVGESEIGATRDVVEALAASDNKPALLLISRGGQTLFLAVGLA